MADVVIELKDRTWALEITGDPLCDSQHPQFRGLLDLLREWATMLPIQVLSLRETPGVAGTWDFQARTRDGRVWAQDIVITAEIIRLRFRSSATWSEQELAHARFVREALCRMILALGLKTLQVTWA